MTLPGPAPASAVSRTDALRQSSARQCPTCLRTPAVAASVASRNRPRRGPTSSSAMDMAWEGPPAAPPPTPARDARSRRSRTAARVARGAQLPADDGSLPPSSRMPTRPAMRSDVEREERWASASAVAPPPGLRRASSNSLVTAMVLSHSYINVREQIGDR
jgi:hypothetical protein